MAIMMIRTLLLLFSFPPLMIGFVLHSKQQDISRDFKELQKCMLNKRLAMSLGQEDLIVGLNKYSHDVSCCILSKEGNPLYIGAKERITRKKHDAGDISLLMEHALESIGASLEDISVVVVNNHHFPALPFEEHLPWAVSMGHYPASYLSPYNVLPGVATKHEISHHLAHAWSVITQCPFDEGVVVVMDGMGESYKAMVGGLGRSDYTSDLSILKKHGSSCIQVPSTLSPHEGWREAETVYTFGPDLVPLPFFKHWTQERSPPELENHGFENMESMGAVYSRISSQIFGDWNACGKVMGLAPWNKVWGFSQQDSHKSLLKGKHLFSGNLFANPEDSDAFKVNWELLKRLPNPNELHDKDNLPFYGQLAYQVQQDLEETAMDFLRQIRERTGAKNLCITGGVGLNSVLNGRIAKESGFEQVFIPPYPGDEGIAVGCALYGLHEMNPSKNKISPKRSYFAPYQGKAYSEEEILDALEEYAPWIEVESFKGQEEQLLQETAQAISDGKVVAWFQGRAEFGPRALGHRSLLADPRNSSMIEFLNSKVKCREDFRPFAPSVLSDKATEWFPELEKPTGIKKVIESPFMSLTTKAKWPERIPAVCHVDHSSRLQTVCEKDNPLYYKLIRKFFELTKVPMVLNTSFNIREPIVESPSDAIKCLLASRGAISNLVLHQYKVKAKSIQSAAGIENKKKQAKISRLKQTVLSTSSPFISEVISSDQGEISRVRVKPVASEYWITLDEMMDLNILELASHNPTVEDVVNELDQMYDGITDDLVFTRIQNLFSLALLFPLPS